MKREEAVKVIDGYRIHPYEARAETCEYNNKAIDMAIEALSKPNYESDTEVRLAVTNRNKDKVVLWDAFGEVEYYPNGEINCVHCPHYHETEDETGVHSHCGSRGRLIDADALMEYCSNQKTKTISNNDIARFPTAQADRPHGEWISRIDNGTWMLECSVCGCRVQEEKYRIAVGENATRCPYCGAELGLGGYLYDEYANRPSQRKGEDE